MKIYVFIVIAGLLSISGSSGELTNEIEICTGEADVILVLDRSESVGDDDYPLLIEFARHLSRTFNISKDRVRLGVASYAFTGIREVNLNTFGFEAFNESVSKLTRGDEVFTNIHAGLLKAEEMFEDVSTGARPGAVKLIVITNDGPANRGELPIPTAQRLHAKNISIVSIGIEKDVRPPTKHLETQALASSPDNYYFVPKYTDLEDEEFLKNLTKSVCRIVTVREPEVDDTETSIYEDTFIDTEIHEIPLSGDALNKPVYTLQPQPNLPFEVNANGKIIVTGLLDRETQDKYIFTVTITDLNLPAFTKNVKVTVYILDRNDNDPIPAQLVYNVEVYEDVLFIPPTEITVVSASDADVGINAAISYITTAGNLDSKFNLDSLSGSVTVIAGLDRETNDAYQLKAVARDGGNPQRTSVDITINIKVLDRNDNVPTFEDAIVNLEYPETQVLGNLHQLVALDLDLGLNGEIEYFIESGNNDSKFDINKDSGHIILVQAFNFEVQSNYQLIVKAEDKGQPKQHSIVTVNIKVTDVDDPITIDGPHVQTIPEDFGTVNSVVKVTATDPENAQISYTITGSSLFNIDASGIIRVVGDIDREKGTVHVYVLTVEATAGGHTASSQVTITVTDVNDNTPVFGQLSYEGQVDENAPKHTPVDVNNEVAATDGDATSPNNMFTYAIISGNTNDAFQIHENSGVMSVNKPEVLDFEQIPRVYVLTIRVTDKGNPSLFSTATYVIVLRNLNDNTPTFPNAVINLEYPESKELGNLYQLIATDLDLGLSGEVEYTIETRDDVDQFAVNKENGYITLLKSFNFESKSTFQLIVKAEDKGQPKRHSIVTVNIKVTDVDDPITIDGPHVQTIPENFGTVNSVVKVTATDPENAQITYTITGSSLFNIDVSGIIRVVGDIDREKGTVHVYMLTVEATAGGHSVSTQITITVTDVNDNNPVFGAASYTGSIVEHSSEGTPISTNEAVGATDSDATSPNHDFTFSIESGNVAEAFNINQMNGVVSVNKPEEINFESIYKVYNLVIKVTDKGQPNLSSTVNYEIIVIDTNDNTPTFPSAVINLKFFETRALGNLYQLVASDLDTGLNGMIVYTMTSGDAATFSVNQDNGYITLLVPFDFETKETYQLMVKAEDKGQPKRHSIVTVNIKVTDVDDPITIDGPHVQTIPENFGTVDGVIKVTATDPENAQITYTITGSSLFNIDASGIIRVVGDIDREKGTVHVYVLTVEATAGGHTASSQVTITVTDVNDNTPVFGQSTYSGNVNEHAEKGTSITSPSPVTGLDNDATAPNNVFSFMIESGNTNNAFTIDTSTGAITVNKPNELDFESTTKQYTLILKIIDQGTPQFSSTATYNIVINNINDNEPTFSLQQYQTTIPENTAVNGDVLTVSATDADGETLTYFIPAGLPFGVSTSGQIYVNGALDIETQETYSFKVSVSDGKYTVTADVIILLSDINDNTPTFAASDPQTVSINENVANQYVVITLVATDDDKTAPNNEFMFSIQSGNGDDKFELNQNGELVVKSALNYNVKNTYQLIIKVEDKGTVPSSLSNTITININVMDVNLNAPQFVNAPYTAAVDENVNNPHVIQVSATDADGPTDKLTFSIVTVNVPFEINDSNGQITGAQTFDSEVNHTYMFTIRVSDEGGLYSETTVVVTINDLNDVTPVFVAGPSLIPDLGENTVGNVVQYSAIDNDRTEPNNVVMYMITSGNVGNVFEIDPVSGFLKVKSALDYEMVSSYTVVIEAADKGNPTRKTEKTVEITIKNINEHTPTLDQSSYQKSVLESRIAGFVVLTVTGSDMDAGSVLTYSIPDGIPFSIDSNGAISLKSLTPPALPLDFETQQQYVFNVTVEDEGGLQSTAEVTVNVIDVNDNDPVFDPSNYAKSIPEGSATGADVVTVAATDKDSGNNGMIIYSIIGGNTGNAFQINEISGKITVNMPLDFETTTTYILKVKATDKGVGPKSAEVMVTVTILDVNEEPMFDLLSEAIVVLENSGVGTPLYLPVALDPDSGTTDNGVVMYSIVSGNGDEKFRIEANTGAILLKNLVDFEKKSSYVITIRAFDKGIPSLTTAGKDFLLTINIGDVNENPTFDSKTETKTIPETTPITTPIITITATDPDNGPAGMLTYAIISGDPDNHFSVNTDTGEVSVAGNLNFNTKSKYELTIRSTDKGTSPLNTGPDDFILTIMLTDDNNNAPIFQPSIYMETISESLQIGGSVVKVTATDADTGSNGEIEYSIIAGNVGDVFMVDEATGLITLRNLVDHETLTMYNLIVKATDRGSTPMTSDPNASVKIIISNENEHAPVIDNLPHTGMVGEEMDAPITVYTVTATDQDGDGITFSIVTTGPFIIDAKTGVITTTGKLDRETKDKYTIEVTASDGKLASSKLLTVMVTDKNDNKPVFFNKNYKETIPENAAVNLPVVTVLATDADIDLNKNIMYMIISGNGQSHFKIDKNNGEISVAAPLDFEQMSQYMLIVRATDKGQPPQHSGPMDANVTIIITDVNDNAPVFDPVQPILLPELTTPQVVATVSATDADSGDNGKVMYAIIDGNGNNKFEINMENGNIRLVGELDYETMKSYKLTIRATDKGQPAKTSEPNDAMLVITVTDDNDNDPSFDNNEYTKFIAEDAGVGTSIVKVSANDEDSSENGKIMYSITGGNVDGKFEIDMTTGQITLIANLDYSITTYYNLTVTATDKGSPARSGTSTVKIYVTDVNNNPPVFNPVTYDQKFPENVTIGTMVDTVYATDADSGTNGEIMYSIISGNDDQIFEIDADSGKIRFKKTVNYEDNVAYTLVVRATDKGDTPQRSAPDATVNIIILDVNDNDPEFENNVYMKTIPETTPQQTMVLTVKATDKDSDLNGQVMYAIERGDAGTTFSIDMNNGSIKLTGPLDISQKTTYTFVVSATDKGDNPRKKEIEVTIKISDVNEPPVITLNGPFDIFDNKNVGDEVFTVVAMDTDLGQNGVVMYQITDGNSAGLFTIDMNTGKVTVQSALTTSTPKQYILKIVATDKGTPGLSNEEWFTINVNPSNHPPTITPQGSIIIREDAQIGSDVITVNANDQDTGDNGQIMYAITGGNGEGNFNIDMNTGVITTAGTLDAATTASYTLEITVSDKGTPSLTVIGSQVINITPVSSPVFVNSPYSACVTENLAAGQFLFTATATDADLDTLTYSIEPTSYPFTIHPTSGIVTTSRSIDADFGFSEYFFYVYVTDGTNIVQTNATVCINDVNDNTPVIQLPNEADICEDAAIGDYVWQVDSFDPDRTDTITLSIVSTDPNLPFTIDNTGKITVASALDYETKNVYVFTVFVSDGTSGSSANVTVRVCDRNEFIPIFAPFDYNKRIPDDSQPGTPIVTVTATDQDTGTNGMIIYSIVAGNNDNTFAINSATGSITLNKTVSAAVTMMYTLTVRATDKGSPSMSSSPDAQVKVIIMKNVCSCELSNSTYPCIKWTKYEVIRKFEGSCYTDKLKKAIDYISMKIQNVTILTTQFTACKMELRTELTSGTNVLPYDQLFTRYDTCTENIECRLTMWKMQLEQKKMLLEKELVIEKDGWGTFNIPSSEYYHSFWNFMKMSQSSRMD